MRHPRAASAWGLFAGAVALMTFLTGCASTRLESAKHIILVIGDGMQLQHEIATSRYLYGTDNGLSFHKLPYRGYVATWDVTT
ncbi:MAG TPA: hypothetical protein PKZ01_05180, partial [Candidatus Hydrogenedentes bacterium]|nr:hypothetical protein [Candidatus Hydrogenedentota bacterium]